MQQSREAISPHKLLDPHCNRHVHGPVYSIRPSRNPRQCNWDRLNIQDHLEETKPVTLPESLTANIPENKPSHKGKSKLPTVNFQVQAVVSFREGGMAIHLGYDFTPSICDFSEMEYPEVE